MTVTDPHISAEKQGVLGLLTLKRPAALNALNTGMVAGLADAIDAWIADDAVQVIAIRGEGARAFCAGGDIRAWVTEGADAGLAFLRAEYRLNHKIATCPKPFLALMHGVTMGGGAGLSVHARHRIADPGLVFAMPEAAIGFVPDIGSTHFLPRCPGEIGMYLALTAGRIGLGDVIAAGLADQAVAAENFDAVLERVASGKTIEQALSGLTVKPPAAALAPEREHMASLFAAASVEAILERLARDGSVFARAAADAIRANSPTSLKLAFHLLRRGAGLSLKDCLAQEYAAATHLLRRPDIREGVRAAIIDKDRAPKWQPSALAAVSDGDIAQMTAVAAGSREFE
jgi:enoyl-CoA hydratase/carnithine racemase